MEEPFPMQSDDAFGFGAFDSQFDGDEALRTGPVSSKTLGHMSRQTSSPKCASSRSSISKDLHRQSFRQTTEENQDEHFFVEEDMSWTCNLSEHSDSASDMGSVSGNGEIHRVIISPSKKKIDTEDADWFSEIESDMESVRSSTKKKSRTKKSKDKKKKKKKKKKDKKEKKKKKREEGSAEKKEKKRKSKIKRSKSRYDDDMSVSQSTTASEAPEGFSFDVGFSEQVFPSDKSSPSKDKRKSSESKRRTTKSKRNASSASLENIGDDCVKLPSNHTSLASVGSSSSATRTTVGTIASDILSEAGQLASPRPSNKGAVKMKACIRNVDSKRNMVRTVSLDKLSPLKHPLPASPVRRKRRPAPGAFSGTFNMPLSPAKSVALPGSPFDTEKGGRRKIDCQSMRAVRTIVLDDTEEFPSSQSMRAARTITIDAEPTQGTAKSSLGNSVRSSRSSLSLSSPRRSTSQKMSSKGSESMRSARSIPLKNSPPKKSKSVRLERSIKKQRSLDHLFSPGPVEAPQTKKKKSDKKKKSSRKTESSTKTSQSVRCARTVSFSPEKTKSMRKERTITKRHSFDELKFPLSTAHTSFVATWDDDMFDSSAREFSVEDVPSSKSKSPKKSKSSRKASKQEKADNTREPPTRELSSDDFSSLEIKPKKTKSVKKVSKPEQALTKVEKRSTTLPPKTQNPLRKLIRGNSVSSRQSTGRSPSKSPKKSSALPPKTQNPLRKLIRGNSVSSRQSTGRARVWG